MISSQSNSRRISSRMSPPSSLKQEFLKKWLMGLQACSSSKKNMSFLERENAIKLSANMAIASARNATTLWSRALIANCLKETNSKVVVEDHKRASNGLVKCNKRVRSNNVLRKILSARRVKKMKPTIFKASSFAKRLVKKRTQELKSLVPGGESMDEFSLMKETLDYVVSLRTQVDAMQRVLAKATEHSCRK